MVVGGTPSPATVAGAVAVDGGCDGSGSIDLDRDRERESGEEAILKFPYFFFLIMFKYFFPRFP